MAAYARGDRHGDPVGGVDLRRAEASRRPESGDALRYPSGALAYDRDEDRVRCHLCGRWYRALAPGHLLHRHGISADSYRELAGLKPRHPLAVRSLSELRARQLRVRMRSDGRIRAGMQKGVALARSGELQARARERASERGRSLEWDADLRSAGSALGQARAAAFRDVRERRAMGLGFADLERYLRARYLDRRATIADLQAELGASYSAVRAELRRFGIAVRRGRRMGTAGPPG